MEMIVKDTDYTEYFKSLNNMVHNPIFMNTVKASWERDMEGNVMWKFHQKLKGLANTLALG